MQGLYINLSGTSDSSRLDCSHLLTTNAVTAFFLYEFLIVTSIPRSLWLESQCYHSRRETCLYALCFTTILANILYFVHHVRPSVFTAPAVAPYHRRAYSHACSTSSSNSSDTASQREPRSCAQTTQRFLHLPLRVHSQACGGDEGHGPFAYSREDPLEARWCSLEGDVGRQQAAVPRPRKAGEHPAHRREPWVPLQTQADKAP